jgi:RecB family exonuclease
MACPHVAGVAAQIWSRFPDCSNAQIRNVLLRTAKHVGEKQGCTEAFGSGLVQARAAYDLLAAEGCEAGGDATQSNPSGGCGQNPDFVKSENPNTGWCPTPAPPLKWWQILLICLASFFALVCIFAVGVYCYRLWKRKGQQQEG